MNRLISTPILLYLGSKSALTKYVTLAVMASSIAPFFEFVDKYIFADWEFVISLGILVITDTLTGVYKYWRLKQISSSGFGRFITKVISYAIFLIILHIAANFTDKPLLEEAFDYFQAVGYAALVVREILSIFENIAVIYPNVVPKWMLARLKDFDENGNLKALNPNNEQPQNPKTDDTNS